MATYDSPDLNARFKRMLRREASLDEAMTDPKIYALLTEAQKHWVREIASHVPESQYGPPTKLLTTDGGITYQFPDLYGAGFDPDAPPAGQFAEEVFACEVYARRDGRVLKSGPYWDRAADYQLEQDVLNSRAQIRSPGSVPKTYTDGPYARYAQAPGDLDASTQPRLQPPSARDLIVVRAAIIWTTQGGHLDPGPYVALEQRIYYGDPNLGVVGVLASLKSGDIFGGAQAFGSETDAWYRGIDTGGWIP